MLQSLFALFKDAMDFVYGSWCKLIKTCPLRTAVPTGALSRSLVAVLQSGGCPCSLVSVSVVFLEPLTSTFTHDFSRKYLETIDKKVHKQC